MEKLSALENELTVYIKHNDSLVCFYTNFSTFFALKSFDDFLGPAVNHLIYSQEGTKNDGTTKRCRPRTLPLL